MGGIIYFNDKDSSGFLWLPNDKAQQEFNKAVRDQLNKFVSSHV